MIQEMDLPNWLESSEVAHLRRARTELNDAERELCAEFERELCGEVEAAGPGRAELGKRLLAARYEFRAAWDAVALLAQYEHES